MTGINGRKAHAGLRLSASSGLRCLLRTNGEGEQPRADVIYLSAQLSNGILSLDHGIAHDHKQPRMTKVTVNEKPPRRRQADRRGETRQRLIDATIACLMKLGYAETTFSTIAKEAGVSRSIIAYHFASKADLMVAVREANWRREMLEIEGRIAASGARQALAEMPRFLLQRARLGGTAAELEIVLAARGDPDLRSKLKAAERVIDDEVLARQPDYFAAGGVELPEDFATVINLTTAAVRGLALAEIWDDALGADACIELLNGLLNRHLGLDR